MTRSKRRKLDRLRSQDRTRKLARVLPLAPMLLAAYRRPMARRRTAPFSRKWSSPPEAAADLQAVPMSIQAFGTAKLEELRINNFTDYAKFMPSVSFQTLGPGFTRVFMRGVASGDTQPLRPDAERRHVPRRAADHDDPGLARHPPLRRRARRDAGGSAGHAVRRKLPGRHDPHDHQPPMPLSSARATTCRATLSRTATRATRPKATSTYDHGQRRDQARRLVTSIRPATSTTSKAR